MEKRLFILILVVVVGVVLGVSIVSHQAKDPLLSKLLQQQGQMLISQTSLERKLSLEGVSGQGGSSGLLRKQAELEQRIVVLESQIRAFQNLIQQAQGAQGAQARAQQPQPPEEDYTKAYTIGISHSPVQGKKNASVTITEFVDFQCPFCARFHPPILEVLKAYPDKVNYMLKNYPLPFHPNARPAAKAAFAAGEQGKYYEMADAILEDNSNLSEDKYKELAKKLGLNVEKFLKDYKDKDGQWEQYIKEDLDLGEEVAVRGTPTFYINGRKTMARDADGFKKEIDNILSN